MENRMDCERGVVLSLVNWNSVLKRLMDSPGCSGRTFEIEIRMKTSNFQK